MTRQRATREELDMKVLMANAAFRRFLLRVCTKAGIWIPTSGADHALQYREGLRSLGLDILQEAAAGLPQRDAGREHVLALILTEATPKETDDDSEDHPDFDR